jgi:hypothetical protein
MLRTNRSAWAFKFGDCGGSFTDSTPVSAIIFKDSVVKRGSRFHVVFRIRYGTGSMRVLPGSARSCCGLARAPDWTGHPGFADTPNSGSLPPCAPLTPRFPLGARSPSVRWPVPSYFWAIRFRCHANKVSGVTMVAIWASTFRPNTLALTASRRR